MNRGFEQFISALDRTYKCINQIKRIEMDEFGLRGTHVMFLYYLGQTQNGMTSAELSSACAEDKAATSRTVRELYEKGLIRFGDPEKRYRARLLLTPAGQEVVTHMGNIIAEIVQHADTDVSTEELLVFYRVLDKISKNLHGYLGTKSS